MTAKVWRKRIGLALLAAAAAGLLFLAFRPAPVGVVIARAERGKLQVTVDEDGKTRVRDRFVMTAPVAGRVERISLHQGDAVELGTIAARIHPLPLDPRARAEATARLEAAEAEKQAADARVRQARAALEQARRAANRARQLSAAGTLSAQECELAELSETTSDKDFEAATFAAKAADYNAQAARAALLAPNHQGDALAGKCDQADSACIELRSPIQGRVLRVPEESERAVALGTPLVELGDPAALEIVIDVLSSDAVKVKPGALVLIDEWGAKGTLRARVRLVEPSGFTKLSALGVEEQRVNVIADFLDLPDSLGDGFRVEAHIVVWEGDNVLQVPSSAVFRRGKVWNVFVVDGGKARHREIEIGHRGPREVEVLSGLEAGVAVVLHPSDQIEEDVRVAPL
jgi:HlyD family secretion protein